MSTNHLWYRQPAGEWTEALPLGNGRLGAMVHGGVGREELQLNEATLWTGGPYQPINDAALAHLPQVRELLFAGRFAEAQALANRHLMAVPLKQMSYQPAGNLFIEFMHEVIPGSYRRSLDLPTAVHTVNYDLLGTGIGDTPNTILREAFVSAADDVTVVRLSASDPRSLTFEVWLDSPQPGDWVDGDDTSLRYRGTNFGELGIEGKLRFGIDLNVGIEGGTITRRGRRLVVEGADAATLVLDIATSFRRYDDVSGDPDADMQQRFSRISGKSYDALKSDHIAAHRAQFETLNIDLGAERSDLPTDERIAAFGNGDDPGFAALYMQYGRYLMLGSSRKGGQAANLQGLWNKDTRPPWNSKYTVNINLEMNYWLPDPANLATSVEPLIRLVEEVSHTGAEMARRHYGARGWVLHHNTDLWRATGPIDGAQWGLWPMGGAWLCAQLWDHAVYAGRPQALVERLLPLLEGAVRFALDTLVPLPGTELLVTAPSVSPENVHPHGASLCYGPAMDQQILRDLFDAYIAAAGQVGQAGEMVAEAGAARGKLPQDRIGAAGQLQEWLDDWDMAVPEMHHRHVSHLYALYPSQQIGVDTTPALAAAARRSLEIRGDDATGWGIGWRINLWARLRQGEHALDVLRLLLSPARSYPNLFDAHPPFQIDGNFGGAAGILEMLVQSDGTSIHLLPALPSAWPSGRLDGVRARGGFELSFAWQDGAVQTLTIRGPANTSVTVHAGRTVTVTTGADGVANYTFV